MKKILGMIIVAIFCFGLLACSHTATSDENAHIPGEPDVINSIRSGNDERLTEPHVGGLIRIQSEF